MEGRHVFFFSRLWIWISRVNPSASLLTALNAGAIWRYTLPETNIAPESRPSQRETHLPTIIFQGRTVNFKGCRFEYHFATTLRTCISHQSCDSCNDLVLSIMQLNIRHFGAVRSSALPPWEFALPIPATVLPSIYFITWDSRHSKRPSKVISRYWSKNFHLNCDYFGTVLRCLAAQVLWLLKRLLSWAFSCQICQILLQSI